MLSRGRGCANPLLAILHGKAAACTQSATARRSAFQVERRTMAGSNGKAAILQLFPAHPSMHLTDERAKLIYFVRQVYRPSASPHLIASSARFHASASSGKVEIRLTNMALTWPCVSACCGRHAEGIHNAVRENSRASFRTDGVRWRDVLQRIPFPRNCSDREPLHVRCCGKN